MHKQLRVGLSLILFSALAVAVANGPAGSDRGAGPPAGGAQAPDPTVHGYLPLALAGFAAPFAAPATAPAAGHVTPGTGLPTATPGPSASPSPGPTPTLAGGPVEYPREAETIILQLGWSDTDQQGAVWEEMNGTPFFTVYGDGRAIGGPALFDWRQELYAGSASPDEIQDWLRPLTYQVQFFTLRHRYDAPGQRTFTVHVYVRYGSGREDYHRVSLGGFRRWLNTSAEPGSEEERVVLLAHLVQDMAEFSATRLELPFEAGEYTVLAHEVNRILPSAPAWTQGLDIAAISDRAPLDPEGGNVRGPPGHERVGAELGARLRQAVAGDARRDFSGYNEAAEYQYRGRRFVVGVRQEVPGGSPFLPDSLRRIWYRMDGP